MKSPKRKLPLLNPIGKLCLFPIRIIGFKYVSSSFASSPLSFRFILFVNGVFKWQKERKTIASSKHFRLWVNLLNFKGSTKFPSVWRDPPLEHAFHESLPGENDKTLLPRQISVVAPLNEKLIIIIPTWETPLCGGEELWNFLTFLFSPIWRKNKH